MMINRDYRRRRHHQIHIRKPRCHCRRRHHQIHNLQPRCHLRRHHCHRRFNVIIILQRIHYIL